jgi:hypothetical protein
MALVQAFAAKNEIIASGKQARLLFNTNVVALPMTALNPRAFRSVSD